MTSQGGHEWEELPSDIAFSVFLRQVTPEQVAKDLWPAAKGHEKALLDHFVHQQLQSNPPPDGRPQAPTG